MPRLSLRIVVLAIAALSLVAPPTGPANAARTIHVPQDAATIQGAINAAVDGDTILVAPGTYRESLTIAKAITLASQYHTTGSLGYRDTTIIDAGGAAHVIWITSAVRSPATITGFTIRNAGDGVTTNGPFRLIGNRITGTSDGLDWEGGIGEVRGNIFEANRDDGIDLDLASFGVIEDNVIRNNGDDGIEIRLHSYTGPMMNIVIRRNVISGNGEDGIQLIDYPGLSNRTFSIENNLIQGNRMVGLGIMGNGNTVEDFSGYPMPEPVFVTNNTFAGNDHGMTGGAKVTARNNIFTGATRIAMKNVAGASTVAYNLFWANGTNFTGSNVDGTKTILADPLLDATYRLRAGSPAIGAGVNVGLPYNGAAPDLGAYETGASTSPSTVSANAGPDQTAVPGTVVGFSGSASGGIAPYTYTWAFGDGTTGNGATVSHTYTAAGVYTVTLTVKDTAGTTAQDTASVTVSTGTTPPPPPSGGTGQTLTFTPVADATIRSGSPDTTYGGATTLETDASPVQDFLLQFNVTGVQGQQVTKATLRLYATNPSERGGDFRPVANQTWSESTVTWNNAPAADTTVLASLGAVSSGQWYEVDVSPLVSDGDGAYTIRVSSTSSNGADYASKEGTASNRPQLVVTTDSSTTTTPPPAPLVADAGENTTAVVGAAVTFSGSASGGTAPYTYTWQFGDGTSGAGASAGHAYTTAGTYTTTLTVKDAADQTAQDTAVVTVTSNTTTPPPPAGGTGQTLTYTPVADATIRSGSPSTSYGSAATLETDASPIQDFLLKFTVSGVGTQRVTGAKLRLYTVNPSDKGGDIRRVASQTWSESTVTWGNAPAADAALLATLGAVTAGQWYEADVTSLITGDGTYSVRVSSTSSNGADYSSKEGTAANRPQLVVTTDASTATPTPLGANAGADTTATAGTAVSLSGSASGGTGPYTYAWQFGDGTSGTGAAVSHTYTTAGTYTTTLTVKDAANQTAQDTAVVTVTSSTTTPPPAGGTGQTLTFTAVADASIRQGSSRNYGSATMLVVDASPVQDVLVKFTVTGVGTQRVTRAALRLYAADASDRGGSVRRVASQAWSESTVTWSNAPAADTAVLGSFPGIVAGQWYEVDVTPMITGDGTYSVRIGTTSTNGAGFNSKEAGSNRPQLVVTTAGSTTTTPALTATAGPDLASTAGTALTFAGSASGGTAPYTYAWQLGDGTSGSGSTVTHTYATAGAYTVTLAVTDGASRTAQDTATVTIVGGTTAPPTGETPPPSGEVRAFPGAEGFGAQTRGGRGGKVIAVTNLNDSGPGSLRAAIDATGPRIVVFRVGGTITVNGPIFIKNPYITIAGQTAPGGGIAIRNSSVNTGPVFAIDGDEVIIRHLRVRPGPSAASSSNVDGITIRGGRNIIVDHSSLSWAVDEIFNTWYDSQSVTVQWSIISESLLNSTHSEGPHGMGMLLGSAGSGNFSAHHNLFAHNNKRNPALKPGSTTDFVNNVIYNWGGSAGWVGDQYGKVPLNFVGNYYKPGPDSDRSLPELDVYRYPTNLGFSLYLKGNLGPHRTTDLEPEDAVIDADGDPFVVGTRNPAPQVTTQTAAQAFDLVLAGAGATKPQRDAVDSRIVSEVRNGTGRIIDHPTQVGGWPALASGTPPVDSDGDGMPDAWEIARGLNPSVDDSAGDRDGDGYTNIEEYINQLAGS